MADEKYLANAESKAVDGSPTALSIDEKGLPTDATAEQRADLALRMGKQLNLEGGLDVPEGDVEFLLDVIGNMSYQESVEILEQALKDHEADPNFPVHTLDTIRNLLDPNPEHPMDEDARIYNMKIEAALIRHHAPYPEVRAVTDPVDDPDMPVETFRAYLLGAIWIIIGSGVSQFFEPRQPPISLPASLLQLLLLPCGKIMAAVLPNWGFTFRGKRYSINPGPYTIKEQILVTIMFNITNSLAYINSQIYVQRLPKFYGNEWAGAGYQITLILSTQFIGFGIAGLARHVLVYPIQALWPNNFPILALNRALMRPSRKETINGWSMSAYKFFIIFFCGAFLYFWLPGYLFTALSTFNWMTWIKPDNFNLAAITGSASGLGINPIPTFDWTVMNYNYPLVTPFFSQFNQWIGALIAGAILIPAVFYSNMYYTKYLPINTASLMTNTAEAYEVQNILTDGVIDEEKYQQYSPAFYSAANLVVYGAFFAMYPAMFVDSCLNHWRLLLEGFKQFIKTLLGRGSALDDHDDAHSRMMRAYPEVPMWWYLVIMAAAFALGIVCIEVYPTETPVWAIFFAIAIGIVFLIPIGLMYATTNGLFSLNVLTELVAGYALPGKGVALMIIKSFGLNTNLQAIYFIQDQKLGHYGKLPPRATFRAQMFATLVQAFVVLGVANWQINNYSDLCEPAAASGTKFTCPNETVYYSASVAWGVIGPRRMFDKMYPVLKYCFLIGALVPVPFYVVNRIWKPRILRQFSPMLVMLGMINFYAPYNLTYATAALYMSFIFMYWIRNRYTAWFEKYVYVLTAALTAGCALSAVIIFFAVQYHPKELSWWGNNVIYAGVDGEGPGLEPLPAKGYFGPEPGDYPF